MSEGMVRAEAGAELLANEEAQAKVREEISQCQARIVQTLVPTILALGLLAVADKQSIGKVALGCGFSVLLCSSLYVASLSHKIFRNGAFLSVFTESESREADQGVHWEKALNKYRRREPHCIIQSETTTAAAIYFVMALTFLYVFDEQHPWVTAVCSALLLGVSVWIMLIYANHSRFESRWEEVRKDIAMEKGLADAKEDACGPAAT